MKQHRVEDSKKKEKQILCQEIKKVREADEVIFLSKLRESRGFILNDADPMKVKLPYNTDKKARGRTEVVGNLTQPDENMATSEERRIAVTDAIDLSRGIDSAVLGATFPSFRTDLSIGTVSRQKSRSTIASLFPSLSAER